MNDGLIDGFRYHIWATRELLAVCRGLSEEHLNATAVGAYGSIIDTMRHYISPEPGSLVRLTGERASWDHNAHDTSDLDELARRVDELEERWERFLSTPFDGERTFVVHWHDGIDRDVPAGVVLMDVLQHAIEHRSQVCTILTAIGVEMPDYRSNLWDYAEHTNRAPRREA